MKNHIEETVGAVFSGSTTSVLLGAGIITTVLEATAVAVVSGFIGTVIAFFTKRWLNKKYGKHESKF